MNTRRCLPQARFRHNGKCFVRAQLAICIEGKQIECKAFPVAAEQQHPADQHARQKPEATADLVAKPEELPQTERAAAPLQQQVLKTAKSEGPQAKAMGTQAKVDRPHTKSEGPHATSEGSYALAGLPDAAGSDSAPKPEASTAPSASHVTPQVQAILQCTSSKPALQHT